MDGKHPIVVDCTDLRHAPEYADIDAAYGEAKHMAARLHRPIAVFVPIGIVQPPQVELTEYQLAVACSATASDEGEDDTAGPVAAEHIHHVPRADHSIARQTLELLAADRAHLRAALSA